MKKLLFLPAIFFAINSHAQLFSEDFEGGSPLSGWTLHGTSGATIYSGDAGIDGLGIGGSTSTFWVSASAIDGTSTGGRAFTTSWFNPAITCDNYLVTPAITLTGGSSYKLSFNAESFGADAYLDPYKVMISSTGTSKGAFSTTLHTNSTGAPNSGGENIEVIIPGSFSGSTVYIAFVATGYDDYILAFDNVEVTIETASASDDMALTSLDYTDVITAGAFNISGTVQNLGSSSVSSFDIIWNDGGTPNSQTFTATIAPGGTYDFTHDTPFISTAGTSHTLEVCVDAAGDSNAANDCITNTVDVASREGTRLPLLETFTSSTSPASYTLATSGFGGSGLDAYYVTADANDMWAPGVAAISYQVDFPGSGDHAYNPDVETRIGHYGISTSPTTLVDGGTSGTPALVDAAREVPTYINMNASHTIEGGEITVKVRVYPYLDYTDAKVYIAILDRAYDATGAASFSNGQTEFHHVLRKMLPDGNGTTTDLDRGTTYLLNETYPYTINFSLPTSGSYDLHAESRTEVVVFVEDADGNILNSFISTGTTVLGEDGKEDLDFNVSVYPNPTSELTNISITVAEQSDVNIEIFNTIGELVFINNNESVSAGNYILPVDISDFAAGTYVVKTTVNDAVQTSKLMVK